MENRVGKSNITRRQDNAYVCEEGRRLLDLFGAAVQELVTLHERQFLAVVEGDPHANRFDLLIHEANEKKQAAKYIYMEHMETHDCSFNHETHDR